MQFIVAAILGGLLQIAKSMVGRVLLALGISFVTYQGIDTGINWLLSEIKTNMNSLPAEVLSFLGWLWVDKAISLMFSAYAASAAIRLAGGTTLTRMVQK